MKVASDLGLVSGYRSILGFPPAVTTCSPDLDGIGQKK